FSQQSCFCKLYLLILAVKGLTELVPVKNDERTIKVNNGTSTCKYLFQSVNNGCYFFSGVQKDFNQAKHYCENLQLWHNYDVTLAMLVYSREEVEMARWA
ncbi:unnamed protein product, partial [Meganyctiphanes norvegica]